MTSAEIDKMRNGIEALRAATPQARDNFWGGADIVITKESLPENPDAFYPPPRQFITSHASEATWLFESLRDLFAPVIDARNKYEFYERLAQAGERHVDWSRMQNAMLDEALRWLDENVGDYERSVGDIRLQ